MPDRFLSPSDRQRVAEFNLALGRHDLSGVALTGGVAIEHHILSRGGQAIERPLHDIDFVAADFSSIPHTLAEDFLFRHIHPNDPPGKLLLQAVHPPATVRVDIFRAYGSVFERATASIASPRRQSIPRSRCESWPSKT